MGQTGGMQPPGRGAATDVSDSGAQGLAPGPEHGVQIVRAPGKLTVSLTVTGVRPDGYHTIDAEMVTVDLCDELRIDGSGDGLVLVDEVVGGLGLGDVDCGPGNLVCRALRAAGRQAKVTLVKRIPARAGLGGGSADAAAVLRWAGVRQRSVALGLGADVPFCVSGGRAQVTGVGEEVAVLPYEERSFVLLLPPVGVDTAACYRAWDELMARRGPPASEAMGNDLEAPALVVRPELARWRDAFGELVGRRPLLAGSGSTWFVPGTPQTLGLGERTSIEMDGTKAPLVAVRTLPPG